MVIEIKEVSRLFGQKRAVDKISLKIEPGQRLGILGPNGSGKTTLIQLVLGFLKPSEGEITIDGVPVFECHYGTHNAKYAIRIDKSLRGNDQSWMGDRHGNR